MNKSIDHTQHNQNTSTEEFDAESATAVQTCKSDAQKSNPDNAYVPDSLWSHVWYGVGGLIVIVIPPLLPGVTVRGMVLGYVSVVLVIYGVICIWGIVRCLQPSKPHSRKRH